MADLSAGDERFRHDHGEADPAVSAALEAYAAHAGGEQEVLAALAGSRLLVPVVALLADDAAGHDLAGDDGPAGGEPVSGPAGANLAGGAPPVEAGGAYRVGPVDGSRRPAGP